MAVIGETEAAAGQVQLTDVAAEFAGPLQQRALVAAVHRAHADRAARDRLGRRVGQREPTG